MKHIKLIFKVKKLLVFSMDAEKITWENTTVIHMYALMVKFSANQQRKQMVSTW